MHIVLLLCLFLEKPVDSKSLFSSDITIKKGGEGEPPLADSQVTDYVPLVYGTVARIFR